MNFDHIDALKTKLASLRPLNEAELKRLRDEFVIENTYNSNAIEGNTLTLRETALILQEGITIAEKPVREHLEAIGHRDAFEYIVTLVGKDCPLAESTIKEIHSLVLMNDAANRGAYRNVPVQIVGAETTPPQSYLVPVQMKTLIAEYPDMLKNMHIIEAVAAFHLRFENIHPFIDGNGRTGRLVMNFELMKAGLLPVNIKFADRRKYYDCFDDYHNTHKPGMLASLIAGYEAEELQRYISIVEPH